MQNLRSIDDVCEAIKKEALSSCRMKSPRILAEPAAEPTEGGFVRVDAELFLRLFDDEDRETAIKMLASMLLVSAEIFSAKNQTEQCPEQIIIPKDFLGYIDLFKLIQQPLSFGRRVILAIDGRCGAGKTTLAKIITNVYGGDFISTDDFYLPFEFRTPERMAIPGGHIDYDRFIKQISDPIKAGQTHLEYYNFNCFTKTATPKTAKLNNNVIVIEGSYSLHPWINDLYSLSAFLNISDSIQKERILKRNGEEGYERFKNIWIPFEDNYHRVYKAHKRCSILINQ